jgi:hypothetical protein
VEVYATKNARRRRKNKAKMSAILCWAYHRSAKTSKATRLAIRRVEIALSLRSAQ